jgi:hypothetical protein
MPLAPRWMGIGYLKKPTGIIGFRGVSFSNAMNPFIDNRTAEFLIQVDPDKSWSKQSAFCLRQRAEAT